MLSKRNLGKDNITSMMRYRTISVHKAQRQQRYEEHAHNKATKIVHMRKTCTQKCVFL